MLSHRSLFEKDEFVYSLDRIIYGQTYDQDLSENKSQSDHNREILDNLMLGQKKCLNHSNIVNQVFNSLYLFRLAFIESGTGSWGFRDFINDWPDYSNRLIEKFISSPTYRAIILNDYNPLTEIFSINSKADQIKYSTAL